MADIKGTLDKISSDRGHIDTSTLSLRLIKDWTVPDFVYRTACNCENILLQAV